MAYQNFRRAAANSNNGGFSANHASETDGSVERKKIEKTLSLADKNALQLFHDAHGRTASEIVPVMLCTAPENSRFFIETDIPLGAIAEEVTNLNTSTNSPADAKGNDRFALPLIPVRNKEFLKHTPRFNRWLLAQFRHPTFNDEKKTVKRGGENADGTFKMVSPVDIFEIYISVFTATLNQFFKTGEKRYAENAWRIAYTLSYFMMNGCNLSAEESSDEKNDLKTLYSRMTELKTLIEKRDSSLQDAIRYKNFVNSLPPHQYYWCLYQLMLESPESVHKSCMARMEFFLFGILTQDKLKEHGCTLSGIEDNFLRMVFERTIKAVPKVSTQLRNFIAKDEMVEFLHKGAGQSVERSLRYWVLMKETLSLLTQRQFSMSEFVARVKQIRTNVGKLQGITQFCLMLSPSCEKYLSDEVIAEFILLASNADKSFTVLVTEMLSTRIIPKTLMVELDKNIKRIEETQKSMVIETKEVKFESADSKVDQKTVDEEKFTPQEYPRDGHGSFHEQRHFWIRIIALAKSGTQRSQQELSMIFANEIYRPGVTAKKVMTMIIRYAPDDSEMLRYFAELGGRSPTCIYMTKKSWPSHKRVRAKAMRDAGIDLRRSVATVKEIASLSSSVSSERKNEELPISFVKFELSRQQVERIRAVLKNDRSKMEKKSDGAADSKSVDTDVVDEECPICAEKIGGNRKFVDLHALPADVARHAVCSDCSKLQLGACPFCRFALS